MAEPVGPLDTRPVDGSDEQLAQPAGPSPGPSVSADQQQFVSLYRRFRPGRFAELRGQPHVVRALQGAVRDERVAHAYLFSGPRGTGKTSTARILARALNCTSPLDGEPCGRCSSCIEIARGSSLDVTELDAASNNGVDAMRDLIAHAALATPGQWKVYIVDEVHMLSNAAANALLKTLEEPPGHVVFVLATTDPQKVPPTIRSRTQHFEFGLLGAETLAELLRDVNTAAGLSLGDGALAVAVRKGRGSARDALSALDQVVASGTAEALRPEMAELTAAIAEEDPRAALVTVAALHEAGWGPQQLATELVDELRQSFLVALAPDLCAAAGPERDRLSIQATKLGLPRLVRSIETLGRAQVDMRDAPDPRAVLEVALVRLSRPELDDSTGALLDRLAHLEQAVAAGALGGRPPGAPPTGTGPAPGAATPPAAAPPVSPPTPPASDGSPERPDDAGAGVDAEAAQLPHDTGARPGFGALRRQRAERATTSPSETAAPAPDEGRSAATAPATVHGTLAPMPPTPARQASPAPATGPPSAPVDAGAPPDRDAVVEAWGDHILRGLAARAKALYSAGRFVSMEGATATFALPNAAHRDRCEEVRTMVERAISEHFAVPVNLRLAVDEAHASVQGSPSRGGGSTAANVAPHELELDPDDDFDPEGPGEAGSVESIAQAKLLEAFPGAEEVGG